MSEVFTTPPAPGEKLTKKQAGYEPHGPFGCRHCEWFGSEGSCPVIGEKVAPGACCDYWNDHDAPLGVGKQRAEYVDVPGSGYTCDECTFFRLHGYSGFGRCEPVIGTIAAVGSCNKWMPKGPNKHWLTP